MKKILKKDKFAFKIIWFIILYNNKNMMKKEIFYNTSELINKGWTQDKVNYFLLKKYGKKEVWNSQLIEKIERKEKFINFENIHLLLSNKEKNQDSQAIMTQSAIERIGSRAPFYSNNNSLLNKLDKYVQENNFVQEIIHFPEGKSFSTEGKFYAYSDGCRKTIGDRDIVSCAGWIENEQGKLIVEFSKVVQENKESFETAGIEKVIEIAAEIGLKKISLHTDSSGEAERIGFSQINPSNNNLSEKLKNFNEFSICYIPREYNQHSDALTKIILQPYEKRKEETILNEKFNWDNPVVDRTKNIYFQNEKLKNVSSIELLESAAWCLYSERSQKLIYNFLINTQTKDFHLVSKVSRLALHSEVLKYTAAEEKKMKSSETELLHNSSVLLNQFVDLKNISIHTVTGGFKAVIDKIKTIPPYMQEEFFNFHKAINQYDSISVGYLPAEILEKIRIYVGQENYKINNTASSASKP